jgi:hypothetical protein
MRSEYSHANEVSSGTAEKDSGISGSSTICLDDLRPGLFVAVLGTAHLRFLGTAVISLGRSVSPELLSIFSVIKIQSTRTTDTTIDPKI